MPASGLTGDIGKFNRAGVAFIGAMLLSGCLAESDGSGSNPDTAPPSPSPPNPLSNCSAPSGQTISDIDSVVRWINAMPKPLTLSCFIASLPRPLPHLATTSRFSVQPSLGKESPRTFFAIGALYLSFVPDEDFEPRLDPETGSYIKDPDTGRQVQFWDDDAKQLLELSYRVPDDYGRAQSIKAEIEFPVAEALAPSAPFSHILASPNNTICSICHGNERQVDEISGTPVFASNMLRNRSGDEVPLEFMLRERANCDPDASAHAWYRCEMLEAIYGRGRLDPHYFEETLPTIYDAQ